MSRENTEVERRWLQLGSTTAAQAPAYVARFFDADADYYPVRKFPEARPCHGLDEIAQFFVDFIGAWQGYEYAIRELVEVGDDRVLACGSLRAEGRETGVTLEADL